MAGYLPDGCTQYDLDRAAGGYERPECDRCGETPCQCCRDCGASPDRRCEVDCERALRNVPKHFDGGDIDAEQHWYGERMCCLECRAVDAMRLSITRIYLLGVLTCGGCGAVFAEVWR